MDFKKRKWNFWSVGILSIFTFQIGLSQMVNGVVSDTQGAPLPGVSIRIEDKGVGIQTDFNGTYSIEAESDDVLIFTYLGMQTQRISVGDKFTINVILEDDIKQLDDVVVTALGITKEKKTLAYSVGQVKSKEINEVKDYNLANSLVGKVSGVNITQSGGVGSGGRITIRGNNSITGNTQALIVVDGIPINQDDINTEGSVYNTTTTGGGISDINPQDVESVSILKGPNAAALYGSRAGNGVIVITTKKGKQGTGLGITLNSNTTVDQVMFLPKYQNVYGQGTNNAPNADLKNNFSASSWGGKLDGSQQLYFDGSQKAYSAYTDNVKNFFRTGIKTINSFSIQKGGKDYSVNFSYTNNSSQSILPNSDLLSHNFNLRSFISLSDKLTLDAKGTYFEQDLTNRLSSGSEGVLDNVYYVPRSVDLANLKKFQKDNPVTSEDFNAITYAGPTSNGGNPYFRLLHNKNDQHRGRFIGFSKLNYQITDWLSIFGRVGGDVTNVNNINLRQFGDPLIRKGSITLGKDRSVEFNSDFLVSLDKDIIEKLNLSANLGGNLSVRTFERYNVTGTKFKIPTRPILSNSTTQIPTNTPSQIKKVNSFYGSATFDYDKFLYLSLTARSDWSSTISKENNPITYGSAGLSALLTRFIDKNSSLLDMLKVRGSFAQVGNDTDVYQLYQTYTASAQTYLGLNGLTFPDVKLNPDLKPETVTSIETGIEFSMFKGRLSGEFTYYNNTTTDLIFNLPVSGSTGFSFLKDNVGEIRNLGYEMRLGGVPIKTDSFSWDVSAYAYRNENSVVSLKSDVKSFQYFTDNAGDISIRAEVGGSIGDIYGKVWDTDSNGNKLVDTNGVPIKSSDHKKLGSIQPNLIGGITNTFTYNRVSLRVLVDTRIGGQVYSLTSSSLDGNGVSERSLQYRDGVILNAMVKDGNKPLVANTKKITGQQYWGAISGMQENYVYEQTNVRLREFALSYSLPSHLFDKAGVKSASIGIIGRNLFFLYKDAPDIDPEVNLGTAVTGQGINYNALPTTRSIGINLNIKF